MKRIYTVHTSGSAEFHLAFYAQEFSQICERSGIGPSWRNAPLPGHGYPATAFVSSPQAHFSSIGFASAAPHSVRPAPIWAEGPPAAVLPA